jgi:acyl-CoA synthetase (AMP-forming)/AMP-acid ligase II
MFSGYWDQPEHTVTASRDLWYRTDDLVVEHPDGSLGFVDRAKDSVRCSGENVSGARAGAGPGRAPLTQRSGGLSRG